MGVIVSCLQSGVKEWKEFAVKGSVVDLSVGIVLGAAWTGLINSVVYDILMPLLSLLTLQNFEDLFIELEDGSPEGPYYSLVKAKEAGATVWAYGSFINKLLAFLILSTSCLLLVKWINGLKRPGTPDAPSTKACQFCMQVVHLEAKRCQYCTSYLDKLVDKEENTKEKLEATEQPADHNDGETVVGVGVEMGAPRKKGLLHSESDDEEDKSNYSPAG